MLTKITLKQRVLSASLLVFIITLPFVFKLMRFIRSINREIEEANKDIRNLLDNSGQGFLSFNADLIIDELCSVTCETMLGTLPTGKNVADVFFSDDREKATLFRSVMALVLVQPKGRKDVWLCGGRIKKSTIDGVNFH